MPLTTIPLPYGVRDLKVTAYTDVGATTLAGTTTDLPYMRTLTFTESEDFSELRGDDTKISVHGSGQVVEWELESGGLSFDAAKVILGLTLTDTGTTPNQKRVLKRTQADVRPFFKIEGQVISDSGGDIHLVMDRARVTGDFEVEFTDGEFAVTSLEGEALGSNIVARLGIIYELTQNETAVALT